MKRQRGKAKIKTKANKNKTQSSQKHPPPNSLLCKAWGQSSEYGIPFNNDEEKSSTQSLEISILKTGSWGCRHFSEGHLTSWNGEHYPNMCWCPSGEQSWIDSVCPQLVLEKLCLRFISPVQKGIAGCLEVFVFHSSQETKQKDPKCPRILKAMSNRPDNPGWLCETWKGTNTNLRGNMQQRGWREPNSGERVCQLATKGPSGPVF